MNRFQEAEMVRMRTKAIREAIERGNYKGNKDDCIKNMCLFIENMMEGIQKEVKED